MSKHKYLHNIISQFALLNPGEMVNISPLGSGHINDTYLILTTEGKQFVLQRINHLVFTDVPKLQNNIEQVTTHIQKKMNQLPQHLRQPSLNIIKTQEGGLYYKCEKGNYWRVYNCIEDHIAYDVIETEAQATQVGKAFGQFLSLLADLDQSCLHETIPRFHDITWRLEQFRSALQQDPLQRAKGLQELLDFVFEREESMMEIFKLGEQGLIPKRITHNDTKCNNVLLDKQNNILCVIDLDTVMPGYVHYDFGDAIRTACCSAKEDERNLDLITMDIKLFKAFTQGFLSHTASNLNNAEISHLAHAPILITFIMGLRFLSDYINGDTYYKITYPEHNLVRAQAQFKLVKSMEQQFQEMQDIVQESIEQL